MNRIPFLLVVGLMALGSNVSVAQSIEFDKLSTEEKELLKNTVWQMTDDVQDAVVRSKDAIIALGWEKELEQQGGDLVKFAAKYQQFIPLIRSELLLRVSENLFEIEREPALEKEESFLRRHWGKITGGSAFSAAAVSGVAATVLGTMAGFTGTLSVAAGAGDIMGLTLAIFSPFVGVGLGLAAGAGAAIIAGLAVVVGGTSYGFFPRAKSWTTSKVSQKIWGSEISFADWVAPQALSKTTANLYCRQAKGSFAGWATGRERKVTGVWGSDGTYKGFATQVSPNELITRCAREIRGHDDARLDPQDVIPVVGVSWLGSPKLYQDYPIFYYSSFVNENGQAGKLSSFFKDSKPE